MLALDAIDAPTELRDQARSASLMSARRALSTAKPSWVPSAVGMVAIIGQAWVATRLFPQATKALWSWNMFAIGLAIAGIAYGVEWALRWMGRRFIRAPRDPSGLAPS